MNNTSINIKKFLESLNLTQDEWAEIAAYARSKANFAQTVPQQEEVRTTVEENPIKKDIHTRVTEVVHQIGVPAHIKGYQYLREAIILVYNEWEYIESVTRLLYPAIAKKYGTTTSRVERAIRHAIEVAYDRGDLNVLHSYCSTYSTTAGKPTNSEMIAAIADCLKMYA